MQNNKFHKKHLRGSSSLQETEKRPDESVTLPVLKRIDRSKELPEDFGQFGRTPKILCAEARGRNWLHMKMIPEISLTTNNGWMTEEKAEKWSHDRAAHHVKGCK